MEGTKSITLEVSKSDLLGQVQEHSYYLGEALKSSPQVMELAAKIQAGSDESTTLSDFIREGCARVCGILSRVVGETTYSWDSDKAKCTFTISTVANFMESQKDALNDAALSYISTYMLSRWLSLVKSDESVRFTEMLATMEEDMRQLGAQRSKPTRS